MLIFTVLVVKDPGSPRGSPQPDQNRFCMTEWKDKLYSSQLEL